MPILFAWSSAFASVSSSESCSWPKRSVTDWKNSRLAWDCPKLARQEERQWWLCFAWVRHWSSSACQSSASYPDSRTVPAWEIGRSLTIQQASWLNSSSGPPASAIDWAAISSSAFLFAIWKRASTSDCKAAAAIADWRSSHSFLQHSALAVIGFSGSYCFGSASRLCSILPYQSPSCSW